MQIHFLGGATTVTGSQFLLVTERARVLIDCGMFQGSPNESIRNRIPFAFDAGRARRRAADPRPPRPLRAPAAAGQGRLPRPDPRDRGHDRARDARPPRLGQAPRGVRQARGALGEAPPRRGRGRRPPRSRRVPGRRRPGRGRGGDGRSAANRRGRRAVEAAPPPSTSRRPSSRARTGDPPTAWPRDPEADLRAQPPHLDVDLDAPLYTAKDAERALAQFKALALRPGGRGRARDPRDLRRCRAHPRLGDHPASASRISDGGEERVDRLLGRPRPARDADPARPDADDRRRLRPRRVDLRRPRARAGGRGDPHPRRDGPDGRRRRRRAARPVVRDRADPGGRLGARPAHRARRDPAAPALSRLADGVEGVRHLSPPPRLLRRGDGRSSCARATRRSTTRTRSSPTT